MNDLTVIYLTQNKLPSGWMEFQQKTLLEAIGDTKIISVSREPMNLGTNIIQTEPESLSNIYWQILKAAKLADTEYIAMAEDDSLYPADHYKHRPKTDVFAYNKTHWSLFSWGEPIYNWRDRMGNYTMIANRESVIDALEERFNKYPNGTPEDCTGEIGRPRVHKNLGLKPRETEEFYTNIAVVNICHELGMDERARRHRKDFGHLRAYDIPYWGEASDLIERFR